MEDFNFNTGDQKDSEERKSRWEIEDDDEDEDSSAADVKESLLFGKSEKDRSDEDQEDQEKKSLFDISQEGLFSGLLDEIDDNEDTDSSASNSDDPDLSTTDSGSVEEEFSQVIEDKLEEAENIVTESPVDEFQQAESTAYLEGVEELVDDGVKPEAAIDQAAEDTKNRFETDLTETAGREDASIPPIVETPKLYIPPNEKEPNEESAPKEIEEKVLDIKQKVEDIEENLVDISNELAEVAIDEEEVEDTSSSNVVATTSPATTTSSSPLTHPIRTHSQSTPPPPLTPIPPSIPGSQPPNPGSPNMAPASNPNLTTNSPDVSKMNEMYYRDRSRGNLLLGGALGYMFGRRRGRIKTEERLQPEIDEQEKEIEDLKKSLDETELEVKKHAREVIEKEAEVDSAEEQQKAFQDRLKELEDNIVEPEDVFKANTQKNEQVEAIAQERQHPLDAKAEKASTQTEEKQPAQQQEANVLHEFKFEPEEEKKFKPVTGLERSKEVKTDARTLRMSELLEIADDIMLENISLKDLYFNKRIDAINLRRVVGEFLRGEDHEKLLARSLESEEIAVERNSEEKFEKKAAANSIDFKAKASPQTQATLNTNFSDISNQPIENVILNANPDTTSQEDEIVKEITQDKSEFMISNNVAIAIGVVAGIVLVLSVIIFSR